MKNRDVAQKTWNNLRLAFLWARKCGVLKRKVLMEIRVYLKCLGHTTPPTQSYYYERQLSFDKTPMFRVKMHRKSSKCFHLPPIPCINPQVDFDFDFDYDHNIAEYDHVRHSSELGAAQENEELYYNDYYQDQEVDIDKRAEEFIAKFYQQMKMQRQISYL